MAGRIALDFGAVITGVASLVLTHAVAPIEPLLRRHGGEPRAPPVLDFVGIALVGSLTLRLFTCAIIRIGHLSTALAPMHTAIGGEYCGAFFWVAAGRSSAGIDLFDPLLVGRQAALMFALLAAAMFEVAALRACRSRQVICHRRAADDTGIGTASTARIDYVIRRDRGPVRQAVLRYAQPRAAVALTEPRGGEVAPLHAAGAPHNSQPPEPPPGEIKLGWHDYAPSKKRRAH